MDIIYFIFTFIPEMLTTVHWFRGLFIATVMYVYLKHWLVKA